MHKRVFIKLPKDRITITLGMSHNLCGSQASYNLIPLNMVIPALFWLGTMMAMLLICYVVAGTVKFFDI